MANSLNHKQVGRVGEDIALRFLEKKGFKILERNYKNRSGEIDIIAELKHIIHFVEVKTLVTREKIDDIVSRETFNPAEKVDSRKIGHIHNVAEAYLLHKGGGQEVSIDVVSVRIDVEREKAYCDFIENVIL